MSEKSNYLINLDQVKLPLPDFMAKSVMNTAKSVLGVDTLNKYYSELQVEGDFYSSTLNKLNINYEVNDAEEIPKEGGLVILANHPFGAVEGVLLGAWLSKVRPDFKFVGNGLLQMIDEMKKDVIGVNPFGNKSSVGGNAGGLRESIRWVKEGHVLVIFPAGEVSSFKLNHMKVEDPKWSKHIGWLIEKTEAPVLPVFFEGRNSFFFQSLGLVHPFLRTLLLPKELLNKSGQSLSIQIGKLIAPKTYNVFKDPQHLINYFRHQIYSLARKKESAVKEKINIDETSFEPIVEAVPQDELIKEVHQLDESYLMVKRGKYRVFAAKSERIPVVLKEIGRLREVTFRAAGEGTGKSIDIDKYDPYYTQLFLWNDEANHIVGAYRLGHTHEILEEHGSQGLYSSSLFKIKNKHWDALRTGLEMGRSFIREEEQKGPMCLPLLWQGICQYLLRNPGYYGLYGCVSICSEYQRSSIDLMIDYLKKFRPAPKQVDNVKARSPHVKKHNHLRSWLEGLDPTKMNPEQLSQMISKLEPDGKGIPVLLKHYLKVGSRILCFNVDKDFADVVDALVIVDLRKTDSKLVERFLGRDGAAKFNKANDDTDRNLA